MPRITVTTDPHAELGDPTILLDERVQSVHLSTDHAASQLIERLAWAILDAESSESDLAHWPSEDRPDRRPVRAQAPIRVRRTRPLAQALGNRS